MDETHAYVTIHPELGGHSVIVKQVNKESRLPCLIAPEGPKEAEPQELNSWLKNNRQDIAAFLRETGGVLFRGFQLGSAEDFAGALAALSFNRKSYIAGNNPRSEILDRVYLSTTYPPSWKITLHSEMSHLRHAPAMVAFFCKEPPAEAGETAFCSTELLLEKMPAPILKKMQSKGIAYVKRMKAQGSGFHFGRSWQEVFLSQDREFAEQYCREHGIEASWEKDTLVAKFHRPATAPHPTLAKEVWFNQGEQWHHSNIQPEVRQFLYGKLGAEHFPHHAQFGDGEQFSASDLEEIRNTYDQECHLHQWQRGDLLILDNFLMAHGRMPFRGRREVFFAMGDW